MHAIFMCLYLAIEWAPTFSWNLSYFAPANAPLGQVAVWRNRAFLCLPRNKQGTVKATLIEAPWPDNSPYSQMSTQPISSQAATTLTRAYPRNNLDLQEEGHCPSLQNITALDVDIMRGWLWVLDSGNAICWAKVIVFDLRINEELWRTELKNMNSSSLTSIVADPIVGTWGPRAYLGARNRGSLVVVETSLWWPIHLEVRRSESELISNVMVETITLSRKEPVLYITATDSDLLFSLNLTTIRSSPSSNKKIARRQAVSFLGYKLGPSRGLVMDLWSGLHYFLSRDHAAVRWDTRRPLSAESHSVLLQSSKKLPYVSHMFLDSQWQVWAVVGQHCIRIQKYSFM